DTTAPYRISGVTEGSAQVTVSYLGASASAQVEVTAAILNSISVQAPTSALLPAQSLSLRAFAHLSDGSTPEITQAATWSSSDPASISVSNDAMSHGVATASARLVVPQPLVTITAEWNGHSDTVELTQSCLASA